MNILMGPCVNQNFSLKFTDKQGKETRMILW